MYYGKIIIDGEIYQLNLTKHYEHRITRREHSAGRFLELPLQLEKRINYDFELQDLLQSFLIKDIKNFVIEVNEKAVVVLVFDKQENKATIVTTHYLNRYDFHPKEGQIYIHRSNKWYQRKGESIEWRKKYERL